MAAAFGSGSATFAQANSQLEQVFSQAKNVPQVAGRLGQWRRAWDSVHGRPPADDTVFVHQTYIALLARLVTRKFLSPRPVRDDEELFEVINGDYFSRRGIGNHGEGDYFSWVCLEERWELGLEGQVISVLSELASAVEPYGFTKARPGILDGLYQQSDTEARLVPHWLAGYVVEEGLGLAIDPDRSLMDPDCGTGTFLSSAVTTVFNAMALRGDHPIDILFRGPEAVRGMGRDPLGVSVAKLNYLLAMGELVQEDHPPFLVPVYLADAAQEPVTLPDDQGMSVPTPVGQFPFPYPFVDNPLLPDWVLGRLTNYMGGAQLRLHIQSEEEAVQEVMNAYYNYLTAAKPRTPVPDALTPQQADVLLETARKLVYLHIRGEGTLWLHGVQNLAAPAILGRRGFDLMAGAASEEFFSKCGPLYLGAEGKTGLVAESGQVTLPDGRRVRPESTGGTLPIDATWEQAKERVRITSDA
ncbi:MAG TPA: hypothetical protein DHW65_07240 [Dehalococcoidia bacterium]|nr:hypothetical protein [Dehalococcoidia bacterium]HCP22661.1 hypothetical protein [Dehalococcoidia bacterium]|tara:strand:+ start:123 stop:1535 length:1413 start_codon:yes stop_codon:yes gene_type:complete